MELSGDTIIDAPQERVYDALHDPVTLRQVLPGCQSLTVADGRSQLSSLVKVGPIRASVATTVELFNEDRPAGYSLYAIGNAGPAGAGAGTAHVALAAVDEETTNLAYHLSVELDGRLGELSEEVVEETARTLIAEFVSRLKLLVESPAVETVGPAGDGEAARPAAEPEAERPAPPPPAPPPAAGPAAHRDTPASTRMVFGQAEPDGDDEDGAEPVREDGPGEADEVYDESYAPERDAGPAFGAERGGRVEEPRTVSRRVARQGEGMSNTRRWLLVALGILVIAYLLSGGI